MTGIERRSRDTPRTPDRRSGAQRRDAFRVGMKNVPVQIDSPMELYSELVDVSVLGARFDRELHCTPGIRIRFRLQIPKYGASLTPDELDLTAEVVRVENGETGVRFVDLSIGEARAVRDLVGERQRMILAAMRENRERVRRDGPSPYA